MANNTLRMSGLNSGLDTEAIVNALTAATKNKINTNQRSILKLQAQQDAYRTIIDKFNAFKNKYFDMLNIGTCLKSKTMFSSFKSTLTSSTGTNYVPGVTVSSNTTANEASYNVKVKAVATQATRKSSADTGKEFDFSNCESGKEYTMRVTVGSQSKFITFTAGDTEDQTRDNINEALKEKFGVTNNGTGLVSLGSDNKFVSTDKSSVVATQPAWYTDKREADLSGVKTGRNSFTITVNGEQKTISFSTVSEDYFDEIFDGDKLIAEEDMTAEQKEKYALYKQVVLNQRDGDVYEAYKEWWAGLDDDQKRLFAEDIVQKEYDKALADWEEDYNTAIDAKMKLKAYNEYVNGLEEGEEKLSFNDFLEEKYLPPSAEDIEYFKQNDEDGSAITSEYEAKKSEIDRIYDGYTDQAKQKEIKASYNDYFAQAKEDAYNEAVRNGEISDDPEDEDNYVSLEDFKFTAEDFEATDEDGEYTNFYYKLHQNDVTNIENRYENGNIKSIDLDRLSESQRVVLFDKYEAWKHGVEDADDYIAHFKGEGDFTSAREAAYLLNKANIENNLNGLSFQGGFASIKASYGRDGSFNIEIVSNLPEDVSYSPKFAITANAGSTNDFGFTTTDVSGTASQVSTTSKLNELGLTPDENGNYGFTINGVKFSFSGDTTISDMMKQINASTAGVKMSYTTLTNQFIITANEYGTGVDIDIQDGGQGLLDALGFAGGGVFTEGTNTELTINGVDVETTSNSYTVDGTTFTFTQAAVGQEFTNEVSRDYSKAIETIKSFVEDYNKLIEDIYGYVDDEPNNDYYFLTDDDIDDMGLSESQQNKWEKMAQKGLLYRDSTLTDIMSKLRSVLYNSVDAADGTKVGLYTLGITTSSDYANHGKLVFDDTKDFEALFEKYADEITTLFTDKEKGIAYQFEKIIDNATRTTGGPGERGTLVDKAGVAGTSSATSNTLYNKIKSLQDMIASLQRRYEQQQDRYWKIYGNMETMLGNLNGQTSYINQLLGNV